MSRQARATARIALVHDWLTGMRGGERVLEALLPLFPAAPIHTLFHFPGSVSPAIESRAVRTSFLQRAPGLRRGYRRYLPLFPAAIESFDLAGFDLVVSSSHCVAKGAIPAPGAFHLCYCHTPMRYAWDQEHTYFPGRRGAAALLRSFALTALRAWDAGASARVDLFAANSRFVAQRIHRFYRRDAEVVHPPVDVDFFTPAEEGAPRTSPPVEEDALPYALVVSALAPYKRIADAIAVCEERGLELRVVGTGPERARLARQAGRHTRLLGHVDDRQLRELYRGACLFLQPGIEDFGIAAAEALACATPVVAVARGGVLDIVEDGVHGVLYPEEEGAGGLAGAIDKAFEIGFNPLDLRQRAESFSAVRFINRMRSLLPGSPSG